MLSVIGLIVVVELQQILQSGLVENGTLDFAVAIKISAVFYVFIGALLMYFFNHYMRRDSYVKEVLSEKEYQVYGSILKGMSNKEIAHAMYIEQSTLKSHINRIYKKLEVRNRKELLSHYQHTNSLQVV